jgi:hypothetical protein
MLGVAGLSSFSCPEVLIFMGFVFSRDGDNGLLSLCLPPSPASEDEPSTLVVEKEMTGIGSSRLAKASAVYSSILQVSLNPVYVFPDRLNTDSGRSIHVGVILVMTEGPSSELGRNLWNAVPPRERQPQSGLSVARMTR